MKNVCILDSLSVEELYNSHLGRFTNKQGFLVILSVSVSRKRHILNAGTSCSIQFTKIRPFKLAAGKLLAQNSSPPHYTSYWISDVLFLDPVVCERDSES